MHSSGLRGEDFRLTCEDKPIRHDAYFADLTAADRVGVFAPEGLEGLGAWVLLLAHVTAFYDRYRAHGADFFAYPDYFTFQRREPCMEYGQLDVWPLHKNVTVSVDPGETLAAITDRAVSILLVPERRQTSDRPVTAGAPMDRLRRLRLASARRTIRRCYLYSPSGQIERATLRASCDHPDAAEWVTGTASTGGGSIDPAAEQTFREVEMDVALEMLG